MTADCAAGPPPGMTWYTAGSLGIRFAYPDTMRVGRFAELGEGDLTLDFDPPLRNAVVLVRVADLRDHSLDAIPAGDVPAIWLDKSFAASVVFRTFQPDTSYEIGDNTVFVFPGFPGPYGDEAFYYVVEFPDGTRIEIAAHRRSMYDMTDTGFDEIIHAILPTLAQIGT